MSRKSRRNRPSPVPSNPQAATPSAGRRFGGLGIVIGSAVLIVAAFALGAYLFTSKGTQSGPSTDAPVATALASAHSPTPPWEVGKGPSWSKEKKLDLVEAGEAHDILIIRAAMRDNPAVDEEFIRKFSRGKTEEQLRVQLEGSYPTFGKMISPTFSDRMWNPKDITGNLVPITWQPPWDDDEGKFEFALDWHPSKPSAAIWTYEDKGGDVYVFDELTPQATRDKTISETAAIIHQIEGMAQSEAQDIQSGRSEAA